MAKKFYTYLEPRNTNEINLEIDTLQFKVYDNMQGIYKLYFPNAVNYFTDYPTFIGKSINIRNIITTHIREIKKIINNLDDNFYDKSYDFSYLITKEQFEKGIKLRKDIAQYSKIVYYLLYTDVDLTDMRIELLEKTDNMSEIEVNERENVLLEKEIKKLDKQIKLG